MSAIDKLYSDLSNSVKEQTRFSVTISGDANKDLEALAERFGMSRAALAKSLLEAAITDLAARK